MVAFWRVSEVSVSLHTPHPNISDNVDRGREARKKGVFWFHEMNDERSIKVTIGRSFVFPREKAEERQGFFFSVSVGVQVPELVFAEGFGVVYIILESPRRPNAFSKNISHCLGNMESATMTLLQGTLPCWRGLC